METIGRAVENPDFVDGPLLRSYLDEIWSLEGELQGVKKDIGDCVWKTFDIKGNLFALRVSISQLTHGANKEKRTLQVIGMPMMGGINFP